MNAPVLRAATVQLPPARAFAVFTEEIGAWWPLPTHGIFGDRSGGLTFRDGQLIEHATDGAEAVWGQVRVWEPPTRLVFSWHPGGTAAESSEVEVEFIADGDGTRVELEHRGWEAFGAQAATQRRPYAGPGAWGSVLDHFADGAEPVLDTADLTDLVTAYDAFFDEAKLGDFGSAPDGEWDADQVLAHVALNDAAILAACQALVHGKDARFDNQVCQDTAVLRQWIDRCGDRDGLIERGRTSAQQTMAVLARLSVEQRETNVHCHLVDHGEVVRDEPLPWGAIAIDTQASFHLPAHLDQLRNLRA